MEDNKKPFQTSTKADGSVNVGEDKNYEESKGSCPKNLIAGKNPCKTTNATINRNDPLETSLNALRTLQQALKNPVASEALTSALESVSINASEKVSVRNRVIRVLGRDGKCIENSMGSNSGGNSAATPQARQTPQPIVKQSAFNSSTNKSNGKAVTINTVHSTNMPENKNDSLKVAETSPVKADESGINNDDSGISCVADLTPCETSSSNLFDNFNKSSCKGYRRARQTFQDIFKDQHTISPATQSVLDNADKVNVPGGVENGLISSKGVLSAFKNTPNKITDGDNLKFIPETADLRDSKDSCPTDASNEIFNSSTAANSFRASLEAWRKLERARDEPSASHSICTKLKPLLPNNNRVNVRGDVQSSVMLTSANASSPNNTTGTALQKNKSRLSKPPVKDSPRGKKIKYETPSFSVVQDMVYDKTGPGKIVLYCEPKSQKFQTRSIILPLNTECKVGRRLKRNNDSAYNAIFDCKVMSRYHAVLWYTNDGKFWVKDTNSLYGTFINENQLDEEPAELHTGDTIKFGIDGLAKSGKGSYECIIATVQLYLPDVPIASALETAQEEATQGAPHLEFKTVTTSDVLETTDEDSIVAGSSKLAQHHQRLERNPQLMEDNAGEKTLKRQRPRLPGSEKLHEQPTMEAYVKACQERWNALQMLAKMEDSYAKSDNQCRLLHKKIAFSKKSIKEVSKRLAHIETEYRHYKENTNRDLIKAKKLWERREKFMKERLLQGDLKCEAFKAKLRELTATDVNESGNDDEGNQSIKNSLEELDSVEKCMELGFDYSETKEFGDGVHKKTNVKSVTESTAMKSDMNLKEDDYDWSDKQESLMSEGESSIAEDADVCSNSDDLSTKLDRVQMILRQLDRSIFEGNEEKSTTSKGDVACTDENMLLLKQCVDVFLEAYKAFVTKTNAQKNANANETPPATDTQTCEPNNLVDKNDEDLAQGESTTNRTSNTLIHMWPGDEEIGEETEVDQAKRQESQNTDKIRIENDENDLQILYDSMHNQQMAHEENVAQLYLIIDNLREENVKLLQMFNKKNAVNKTELMDAKMEAEMNRDRNLTVDAELNEGVLYLEWDMGVKDGIRTSVPKAQSKRECQYAEAQDRFMSNSSQSSSCNDDINMPPHEDRAAFNEIVQNRVKDAVIYKKYLKKAQNDNAQLRQTVAYLQNQTPDSFWRLMSYRAAALLAIITVLYFLWDNY